MLYLRVSREELGFVGQEGKGREPSVSILSIKIIGTISIIPQRNTVLIGGMQFIRIYEWSIL